MAAAALQTRDLIAALPETLREMAIIAGLSSALKIAHRFGGRRLYFTREPSERCELARAVGLQPARALGRHYAGEQIEVPLAGAVRRMVRDREIRAARSRGWSLSRIGEEFRLTPRQVRRILKAHSRAEDRRQVSRAAAGHRGQDRARVNP
jgi:Mor family transcriptional regulator